MVASSGCIVNFDTLHTLGSDLVSSRAGLLPCARQLPSPLKDSVLQLGSTAIGAQTKQGVVLAVEKRVTSPLLVRDPPETSVPMRRLCQQSPQLPVLLPQHGRS